MTDAPPWDPSENSGALVLFSGGQDSATCLAWSLETFPHVETVAFDYGQRHAVELACRKGFLKSLIEIFPCWANRLGADHVLTLDAFAGLSETAMTRDVEITLQADGLPNTFVPGRNLLFFTYSAALAYRRGLRHLVGGMCETDYSGYPDCRDDTLKALQATLNLGMASRFVLHTPLMWRDKAATWELAGQIGGTALNALILEMTHSCYLGDRRQRHPWGYGCAACPACALRQAGWEKWQGHAPNKLRSAI